MTSTALADGYWSLLLDRQERYEPEIESFLLSVAPAAPKPAGTVATLRDNKPPAPLTRSREARKELRWTL